MKKWQKILIGVGIGILALILISGVLIFALWHNEIGTLMSMEKVRERNDKHLDGAVYTMEVKGGFYFDEFLEKGGVTSDEELINFITKKITKGLLKMEIEDPEIGCSSFTVVTDDGDKLFGRNYDFAKTNIVLVTTDAVDGRHATISSVDLQFLGIDVDQDVNGLMDKIICLAAPYAPLDGINDAGVSCGVYMSYQGNVKTISTNGAHVIVKSNTYTN